VKPCPYCGKELPEEMQFCPYCMEKLLEETPAGGTPTKSRALWRPWLTAAAVILLLLLLWLLWPESKPASSPIGGTDTSAAPDLGNRDTTTDSAAPNGGNAGGSVPPTDTTGTTGNADDIDPAAGRTTNTTPKKTTKTAGSAQTTTTKSTQQTTSTTSVNSTPCASGHDWEILTKTVHHEEEGHYETVTTEEKVTLYRCALCYEPFTDLTAYYLHFDTHLANSDQLVEIFRERYETDTEYREVTKQVWVVDQPTYDETVTVGRRCQRCGKTEENE